MCSDRDEVNSSGSIGARRARKHMFKHEPKRPRDGRARSGARFESARFSPSSSSPSSGSPSSSAPPSSSPSSSSPSCSSPSPSSPSASPSPSSSWPSPAFGPAGKTSRGFSLFGGSCAVRAPVAENSSLRFPVACCRCADHSGSSASRSRDRRRRRPAPSADWDAAALDSPRGCAAASVENDAASCGGVTAAPACEGGSVTADVAGSWPGQPAQSGPQFLLFLRHESHFCTAAFGRPRPRPDAGAAGSRAGSAWPSSIAVSSCRSLKRLNVAVQKSRRGRGASSRCARRRPAAPNARSTRQSRARARPRL
mmetsp:Transcript_57619/g.151254  ORF Transcript_57619/g.151254 Transcript_57619/m.151254 type:complete len:310 (-) Transcript_57619:6-935(-)